MLKRTFFFLIYFFNKSCKLLSLWTFIYRVYLPLNLFLLPLFPSVSLLFFPLHYPGNVSASVSQTLNKHGGRNSRGGCCWNGFAISRCPTNLWDLHASAIESGWGQVRMRIEISSCKSKIDSPFSSSQHRTLVPGSFEKRLNIMTKSVAHSHAVKRIHTEVVRLCPRRKKDPLGKGREEW